MIGRLAALILVSLAQTAEVPHLISLNAVELGDNATFTCPVSDTENKILLWCKQPLGQIVQMVAAVIVGTITVTEQFKDSRFTVTKGDNHYLLTIRNVSKVDEATYFCQSGTSYSQTVSNGTFLAVNGCNEQKHVYVHQSPETASVQLGASMTLQCSLLYTNKESRAQCPGEHSVHWFRAGSGGFHPGIIYTHSNRSDEQEERSCVYSLSKTIQNSSDAGTYYCAVVTCGEILFGEGTKVETRSGLDPVVVVLGGLLACCVTVIVILIFFVNQRVCEHCKGAMSASCLRGHDGSAVDGSNNVDGEAVNYVALTFSARKAKRLKKRESPQECL
ncbi:uncharacterized protein LOC111232757 [Seriola dumerili]|uniref:uncharacterized protein LOC111232757 n=1 Tax=Seriola dumerili TaxID=41447 RepID=UPI000BBE2656|nr:uncharacterized protein LOC111232757 [Seriola dumerili]